MGLFGHFFSHLPFLSLSRRRPDIDFQCRGVLLIWIRVGQGPTALAVGAGGGCLDIFLSSIFNLSLQEAARYNID